MINISRIFPWLCLTVISSHCMQPLLPLPGFQQNIAFPGISGEFHTSTASNNQYPIRQISAGFHLNPPPPLPFLQSFPVNPQLFSVARNAFPASGLGGPLKKLFEPNFIRQKPQSDAQEEEYRKYLKEEAEELEKENQHNDITTDFENIESTTLLGPNQKTFVRVNIHGQDYSYSS